MCQTPVLSRMTPQRDNGEEDMMEWHASGNHRSWLARREATWNAIASSGYLAPGRMAMDEARERTLAEAAHTRLLAQWDAVDAPIWCRQGMEDRACTRDRAWSMGVASVGLSGDRKVPSRFDMTWARMLLRRASLGAVKESPR